MRALVGIVMIFSVYLVYEQWQILRMSGQLSEQIEFLAQVHLLTAEVFKLAALDQVTGLYSRRSGEQRLAEANQRQIWARIRFQGSDLAVRLGGAEFMMMLPKCRAEEARHASVRLEGGSLSYEGEQIPCRFSRKWVDYRPGEIPRNS